MSSSKKTRWNVSRRGFIRGVGLGSGALGTADCRKAERMQEANRPAKLLGPGNVPITLQVNGKSRTLEVEPRITLLDALRDHLDLTGAKATCDRGTCGSCTVILNGKAVYACSMLAIDAQGTHIQTIESVSADDPLITAMVRHDGTQCGFCTSGMVLAAKAFMAGNRNPSEKQVAAGLGGNLCRCGTYVPVRKAVVEAARNAKGGRNG